MLKIATGLLAVLAAGAVQAQELSPMQARWIVLGDVTGVAYYTVAESGYEVVATLSAGEDGTPMRVITTLSDGQRMVLSVPRGEGEAPLAVEIARLGDAVFVSDEGMHNLAMMN